MLAEPKIQSPIDTIETYLNTWKPQALDQSHSFPSQMYTDERVYQLEQQRVFGQRWLFAGHISQIEEPGSYFTLTLAEQPLVITRDLQGTLRAFFNVCPHRAGPVALGQGRCSRLTCLYHAWTFDLDGALKATPHMEDAHDFDASRHGLKPVQIDTWESLIFVNLDPDAPPLQSQLGELPHHFQRYQISRLTKVHQIDYMVEANWKLYVENSSESYHAAMVHPSLDLFRNLNHLELTVAPHAYVEYMPFLPNSDEMRYGFQPGLSIEGLNQQEMQGTSVTVLFPNFVLVTCPNFVLARMINPQGLSKTHVRFEWLVPDTEAATASANVKSVVGLYDAVVQEDLEMLKHVQQRVRSPAYSPGRLSPQLEVGVHHFQKMLMTYLHPCTDVVSD